MKTRILLTFTMIILSMSLFGNYSIDWMKTPPVPKTGTSIATDQLNNVYTTSSDGSIHLEKHDRFGNYLWDVVSSTSITFNYEYPVKVFVDPMGDPVVIGYRHTHSSNGNNANAIIILKYNQSGNLTYKNIITGNFSYFNNSRYWTNISPEMDASGNMYIGTAGIINGNSGFNVIKVSPAGNIIRIVTKDVNPSSTFFFVNKLRLHDNLLGVTGVTMHSSANATSWVLDTTGADKWTNIATGIQGNDILFDNLQNAYVLTSVSVNSYSDAVMYKYDLSGVQIWNHNYDFGGSELSAKMENTPDGNIAAMIRGNQSPTGSPYTDWITCKIDTSGNLLWSDRFDEHSNNDEVPYMLAIDHSGNIFVSGIGGPFPGGFNLGKRQMITIKYTPTGTRDWYSAIDTINEYMTGIGIAIGSDSSIYVVGDVETFIVHYFDHTGNSPCSVPQNVTATVLSNDSVRIDWTPVSNAIRYHIQYKPSSSLVWQPISTDTNSFTITPLFPGTTYDFNVEATCNSGPTGFSAVQQFTTTGNGYCQSYGTNALHEWIDLVYIETLLNNTADTDSGYADYTYLSVNLIAGNPYDITLSAGMDVALYTEQWKVWIDYNKNGDFTDPGEEVVSYSSSQIGWETNNFVVPANTIPGQTIMRVSMKNGLPQTPCEIFGLGEVEDYTVNIGMATGVSNINSSDQISLYPNPAKEFLNVNLSHNQGKTNIMIIDITGNIVSEFQSSDDNLQITLNNLPVGIYLLKTISENGISASGKFTIVN